MPLSPYLHPLTGVGGQGQAGGYVSPAVGGSQYPTPLARLEGLSHDTLDHIDLLDDRTSAGSQASLSGQESEADAESEAGGACGCGPGGPMGLSDWQQDGSGAWSLGLRIRSMW